MNKIEKICCPILEESVPNHSSKEISILVENGRPKKIISCDYKNKYSETCKKTGDECRYIERLLNEGILQNL